MTTTGRALLAGILASLAVLAIAAPYALELLEPATVGERLEAIRCEQWGGRFADPCEAHHEAARTE